MSKKNKRAKPKVRPDAYRFVTPSRELRGQTGKLLVQRYGASMIHLSMTTSALICHLATDTRDVGERRVLDEFVQDLTSLRWTIVSDLLHKEYPVSGFAVCEREEIVAALLLAQTAIHGDMIDQRNELLLSRSGLDREVFITELADAQALYTDDTLDFTLTRIGEQVAGEYAFVFYRIERWLRDLAQSMDEPGMEQAAAELTAYADEFGEMMEALEHALVYLPSANDRAAQSGVKLSTNAITGRQSGGESLPPITSKEASDIERDWLRWLGDTYFNALPDRKTPKVASVVRIDDMEWIESDESVLRR